MTKQPHIGDHFGAMPEEMQTTSRARDSSENERSPNASSGDATKSWDWMKHAAAAESVAVHYVGALKEIDFLIDDKIDVEDRPDGAGVRPNLAMQIRTVIEEALSHAVPTPPAIHSRDYAERVAKAMVEVKIQSFRRDLQPSDIEEICAQFDLLLTAGSVEDRAPTAPSDIPLGDASTPRTDALLDGCEANHPHPELIAHARILEREARRWQSVAYAETERAVAAEAVKPTGGRGD